MRDAQSGKNDRDGIERLYSIAQPRHGVRLIEKKTEALTMIARNKFYSLIIVLCLAAQGAGAQQFKPAETRNAALRYWSAFALMQDPPADKDTGDLLMKAANGKAEWDEAKLGPIIDQNNDAILTMQRATRLPECDWGLEYGLGSAMPIPPYAKARVLANLNVLYGLRLAAHHDMKGAVDSWLAGIRFSEHLPQGMSLIGLLIAKVVLISNLQALDKAALSGALDEDSKTKIATAIGALPEYGLAWGRGWQFETYSLGIGFKQFIESPDPKKWYADWMGEPLPASFEVPTPAQMQAFNDLMAQTSVALELPYSRAKVRVAEIESQMKGLNPVIQNAIPSLSRTNDARGEISAARQKLLLDVAGHS
jgi:hypothetical protein